MSSPANGILATKRLFRGSRIRQSQAELHLNDMAAKPPPAPARIKPQADPPFFIIEGITAEENDSWRRLAD
jgi:hypothetical protein